jgi:hypothetical protein
VKFSLSLSSCSTYLLTTGTDRCGNQTNRPLSSCSTTMVAPVLDRCAREPNRGYPQRQSLGIHPIPPQSTSADPLTTSFKDTNRFCFTAPNHGSYQYLYTETDKLSFFLTLRDAYAAGQHIRPNDPNKTRRNGIIHQPILFSKQRDYGNGENIRRRRDIHSVSLRTIRHIYRQCLASFPLACTGMRASLPLQ